MAWDVCQTGFATALQLIESLRPEGGHGSALPEPRFLPVMMKSLLFVAKRCRAPDVRHRTIKVMEGALAYARRSAAAQKKTANRGLPGRSIETKVALGVFRL